MSCSRMGFNLLTRQGWKNLFSPMVTWGQVRNNFFRDTFGQVRCWIVGHRRELDDSGVSVCYRCCQYLSR